VRRLVKSTDVEKLSVVAIDERTWVVLSSLYKDVSFQVSHDGEQLRCVCPDGWNGKDCVHRKAVISAENFKEKGEAVKLTEETQTSKTKLGYEFGEVASALQKEIRRGDEYAALFWGMELYDTAYYYFWKRILIIAAEDVGIGDPDAVRTVINLAQAWKMCKDTSRYVDPQHCVMAIMVLARANKSTEVDDAKNLIMHRKKNGQYLKMPAYAVDCHTKNGKLAGKTEADWYADRSEAIGTNQYRDILLKEFPEIFVRQGKF
jgi:replication-associated recombination protein RarA